MSQSYCFWLRTVKKYEPLRLKDKEMIFLTEDEKKLIQAKHRLEQAENRDRAKERKQRTRRLIQEGAILEKVFPKIQTMDLGEVEEYLLSLMN